jgi:glycogen synthase
MRVAMLAWEYPPLVIGGIAVHVDGLARALVRAGHEVVVLSLHHAELGESGMPDDTVVDGVRVLRADTSLPWLPPDDLVAQMASANHQLTQLIARLGSWRPDVIHGHDWLVAWAADNASVLWGVPLVATVHATERGRHGGFLPAGTPAAINSIEWWLTYRAAEVITCSRFMSHEVIDGFELPAHKVHLVPNGIDPAAWAPADGPPREREPLVLAWGRIQYEKGFQVLIRAMADLRHRHPELRCVIAGRGSFLPELQSQIDVEGVGDVVQLSGFVSDAALRELAARAACVVIPSLYEPFGIVALEGMAAGAPMVVARTGGLAETLDGTGAAAMFEPGDHDGLATRIAEVIESSPTATSMTAAASGLLTDRYSWDAIAMQTLSVYATATRVALAHGT